jgi:hypothetical protein
VDSKVAFCINFYICVAGNSRIKRVRDCISNNSGSDSQYKSVVLGGFSMILDGFSVRIAR